MNTSVKKCSCASHQKISNFSLIFCRSHLTSCLCLCIFLYLDLDVYLYWMFKIFDETRRDEARCSVHSTEKEGVVYVNVLLRVVFAVANVAVCVVVSVLSCLCLGVRAFSVSLFVVLSFSGLLVCSLACLTDIVCVNGGWFYVRSLCFVWIRCEREKSAKR